MIRHIFNIMTTDVATVRSRELQVELKPEVSNRYGLTILDMLNISQHVIYTLMECADKKGEMTW